MAKNPGGRWIVTLRQYSKTSGNILKHNTPIEVQAYTQDEAITKAKYILEQRSLGNQTPGLPNNGPHYNFAAPLGPYPYESGISGSRIVVIDVKRIG